MWFGLPYKGVLPPYQVVRAALCQVVRAALYQKARRALHASLQNGLRCPTKWCMLPGKRFALLYNRFARFPTKLVCAALPKVCAGLHTVLRGPMKGFAAR